MWRLAQSLEKVRFYDGCIVGGGDTAFASGVYDQGDTAVRLHGMNVQQSTRYREWARAAHSEFQTNISFLNLTVDHLWHGSMENRNPSGRHTELNRYNFNPYEDIAIDPGGAWRWDSDKTEMHQFVREYFRGRDEDRK